MKLFLTTIAACALLPLSALAQNSFPAPPPELSVSTEYGPSGDIGGEAGMLEEGFSFSEESEPLMLMAQSTAPAPPKGGGDMIYMRQGGPGPGGPGDHFQMR